MSDTGESDFDVRFHRAGRRALAEQLPEAVAAAVIEFLQRDSIAVRSASTSRSPGPSPAATALGAGRIRIVYRVDATTRTVDVVDIARRGSVHRPR